MRLATTKNNNDSCHLLADNIEGGVEYFITSHKKRQRGVYWLILTERAVRCPSKPVNRNCGIFKNWLVSSARETRFCKNVNTRWQNGEIHSFFVLFLTIKNSREEGYMYIWLARLLIKMPVLLIGHRGSYPSAMGTLDTWNNLRRSPLRGVNGIALRRCLLSDLWDWPSTNR